MTYTPPKKRHWEKFNFSEWRNDDKLRKCSRGARSLWLDMCGLIYAAQDNGRLSIDGKNPTVIELARLLGDDGRAVRSWIEELERKGVFDRDPLQFIVSRRIWRELLKAQKDSLNGKKGGNPALKTKGDDEEGVKAKSQSQSHIDKKLAASGITPQEVERALSVIGPGMPDPDPQALADILPHWLTLYDLNDDVLPVLKAKTAKAKTKPIGNFQWFAQALAEHHKARTSGLFAPQASAPKPASSEPILPRGIAREAAFALIEDAGADYYRAWFEPPKANWNGKTVELPAWAVPRISTRAVNSLTASGYTIVAAS